MMMWCDNDDGCDDGGDDDDGDDVMLSPTGSAPILPIIASHNYWHCNCIATIGITKMYLRWCYESAFNKSQVYYHFK